MSDPVVLCEIAPGAEIDPTARIGRWCVIGPQVAIGPGTCLEDRVTIMGRTIIGRDNHVGGCTVLGGEPQDLKYRGSGTWLVIGDRNWIGRSVTAHVGTEVGGWATSIGDDTVLDDTCHIAHDCYIANGARIGRGVLMAGHVVVQSSAVVESLTGIHHFTRIGRYARVGPRTPVRRDVPPFVDFYSEDYYWDPPMVRGVHEAGIAAARLTPQAEAELRKALATIFNDESAMATQLDQVEAAGPLSPELKNLCRFCRESLEGLYGRYREKFRGQIPPEAEEFLPPELLDSIRREMQ